MQKENAKVVVKLVCFPGEFLSGVSRFFVSDGKTSVRSKIGRCRIKCGKTPNLMGFTLIELLVVVLIIGILAAVALPKYQLAVDKARFTKLLTPITSIAKAIDAYYLTNGTFPTQWDELGITLPGTVDTTGHTLIRDTALFKLAYQGVNVQDTTLSGIIIYRFSDYRTDEFGGKTACYANTDNSRATKLCKSLSGKTTQDAKASYGAQLIYFIN